MGWVRKEVPESEVNLALNWAAVLSVLVILKLMVEVTSRLDSISMKSSGSGSVPSILILNLHRDPSCLVIRKSKDTLPGFIGLNKN